MYTIIIESVVMINTQIHFLQFSSPESMAVSCIIIVIRLALSVTDIFSVFFLSI